MKKLIAVLLLLLVFLCSCAPQTETTDGEGNRPPVSGESPFENGFDPNGWT